MLDPQKQQDENHKKSQQKNQKKSQKKSPWKIVKVILITILSIIIILLLAIPPIIVYSVTQRHVDYAGIITEMYPMHGIYKAEDFNLDTNEMMLETQDGLRVWASEVYVENPKAIIIYLSGILQPSVTYFYGHSKWMKDNGYASILLEVRGHGKSDGNTVCLGYEEVADVQAVVDYIKSQANYENVPIVLHGVSMGGAIAVNSFGQIPEIKGLIAMSSYSSFEDVVSDMMQNYHIPKILCEIEKPLVRACLSFVFGEKVNEMKPIEQIRRVGERPAFLIACADDVEVPALGTIRLSEQAPEHSETWIRDSWEHFIIQNCDFYNMEQDTEYCERILGFLENRVVGE